MNNFNGNDEIIFNSKSRVRQTTTTESGETQKRQSGSADISFRRRERKISPQQWKEMEEECSKVVVHDFDDEYHLSEKERKEKMKFYEAFSKIRKVKKKYRKLDEFVKVYRLYIECLKIVAEDNGIYDPDKFMKLVLRGKIRVTGLTFPKYIGRNKKNINWKYISDFIANPDMDISELTENVNALDNMPESKLTEVLFNKRELKEYEYMIDNPKEDKLICYVDESDAPDGVAFVASKKETKNLTKTVPEIVQCVKDMTKEQRRRNAMNNRMNSFVFEMTSDDFEYIAGLDSERGYQSDSDIPEFKGDILNQKDYMLYLDKLQEYEREHIKYNYEGKMRTQAEINEIMLKNELEAAGWNVRNLYKNKDKEKKLRKAYKESKKREEELKKRLIKTQKRNEKRFGNSDIEFNSKKHKKKKKKKDKESD